MKWEATIGENIMYNSRSAIEAVLALAIDDGVASRGHRTNIFKSNFYYTGCGTDMHKKYKSETVTTFSGSYKPDLKYKAPTIKVPTKMSENTGFSKWDAPAKC